MGRQRQPKDATWACEDGDTELDGDVKQISNQLLRLFTKVINSAISR